MIKIILASILIFNTFSIAQASGQMAQAKPVSFQIPAKKTVTAESKTINKNSNGAIQEMFLNADSVGYIKFSEPTFSGGETMLPITKQK